MLLRYLYYRQDFLHLLFKWMFFTSVKEITTIKKEINRLLSKGMFSIKLKQ